MLVKSKNGEVVGIYEVLVIEQSSIDGFTLSGITTGGKKAVINKYASLEAAKTDLNQIYQALSNHQGGVHFDAPQVESSDDEKSVN